MEKLLKLLNEYVEKYNKSDLYYTFELDKDNGWLFCYDDTTDHKGWTMQDEAMVICSKQFGFIKRLVDSDKIDERKLDEYRGNDYDHFNRIETLIQILSIQDNPIELLYGILK